ncbi:MAG TPA: dicarboxylate/amino acid:cation symporter [Gemmatimonadetes bacterium]|jgi:Na+/H+-dicarboxylate symporter|nr:dicarboxylate/amino acid:cation symporter [Gemmatimonadota bacterium]MEC9298636.1 dicarboxylate/amino acid:cation symporter [Gemmatimonadota bacterium]MED5563503.1 dicarboxylate/amino acid:cation symporter [Gemmatimonadota bacterium]HAT17245.1 dicarboxylate/amino acid:cation symporter [Gemmatimonadota bacterium]|tara:strand:- start:1079 stop:2335 length:1257 start_codon:yes stop_codon:yes gene_type:complete
MEHNPDAPWYGRLHWQVLTAMVVGALFGFVGGEPMADRVGWIGDLFMKLLRMVIVPLVLTSIISGVASVGGGRSLGRLFSKTMGYYVLSSFLAAFVGLLMVNLIRPGVGANLTGTDQQALPELSTPESPIQLLLDIVPQNVVQAAATADMLALIFFCIVFGAALSTLPDKSRRPLVEFFDALFHVMMTLTSGIIKFLPIGVFALITRMIGTTGFDAFRPLAMYALTIFSGVTIHFFVSLPILLILLGRISPRIHFANMREPLLIAFSTSSSGATLPVTMNVVEEKVGVSNKIASFVLPMGATINMDGTAVFECAGALFIAQAMGFDLTIMQQGIVVLTALLASIGAAAVPSAGLVVIFIVLGAIGLEGPDVNVIVGSMLAIDRPLDMYRTAANVFSDSCGAAIIARSEGETGVDTEVR